MLCCVGSTPPTGGGVTVLPSLLIAEKEATTRARRLRIPADVRPATLGYLALFERQAVPPVPATVAVPGGSSWSLQLVRWSAPERASKQARTESACSAFSLIPISTSPRSPQITFESNTKKKRSGGRRRDSQSPPRIVPFIVCFPGLWFCRCVCVCAGLFFRSALGRGDRLILKKSSAFYYAHTRTAPEHGLT